MQSEVDILSELDHPNVVKLFEIFDEGDSLYLVMELMTGGEVSYIKVNIIVNSYLIALSRKSITLRKRQLTQSDLLLMQSGIATVWESYTEI